MSPPSLIYFRVKDIWKYAKKIEDIIVHNSAAIASFKKVSMDPKLLRKLDERLVKVKALYYQIKSIFAFKMKWLNLFVFFFLVLSNKFIFIQVLFHLNEF